MRRFPFVPAFLLTLAMAVAYTTLDVIQPREPLQSVISFLPGAVSAASLLAAGLSRRDLKLRYAPLSRAGGLTLAVVTLLLVPILGGSSGFIGWQRLSSLIYAPASGIAQELYFRSSLLPALEHLLPGRATRALLLHSLVFVGFHVRTFMSVPSLPVAVLIGVVLFFAGCGWGRQVQRDGTVVWAMVQHSLFLVLMSMFAYG